MARNDMVEFIYDKIQNETDFAFYFKMGNKYYWLPKSKIVIFKVSKKVEVPEWMVSQKGM